MKPTINHEDTTMHTSTLAAHYYAITQAAEAARAAIPDCTTDGNNRWRRAMDALRESQIALMYARTDAEVAATLAARRAARR
jgi:hypothetical protein